MFEVYLDPCTVNSRKVLAGLDLLGSKYHFNHVDYFAGAHKSPEFLEINPHGTVPAAVIDELSITESNAILQYAAELSGFVSAYPRDLKKRADVNRWLLWETSTWFPTCYVYLVEFVVKPLLKAEPDQSIIDNEAPKWHRLASILDARLSKSRFLTGDDITIADIAVASPMHLHAAQQLPLEDHPHLKRWLTQDIESLPCWKKTQGAVEKALLPGKTSSSAVHSNFNYTKELEGKLTELYFYEDDASKDVHEPGDDPHELAVHDGWHRANDFSVDKEGFSLHDFKTAYDQWNDDTALKEAFYPEVVDFLKRTTGAKRVLVFDHTIRSKANQEKKLTQETNTSQRAPVMLVHCDYTSKSAPLRVRQLLGDEAEELLKHRVAFFNVWKPFNNTVEERPLAMCDVTTAPFNDFHTLHLRYRDRTGENYVMRYSPNHKWWYFPKMTPDQCILLKTYESDIGGRARFVGHTAFEDPTSSPDAPTRESVEIRTMAFF